MTQPTTDRPGYHRTTWAFRFALAAIAGAVGALVAATLQYPDVGDYRERVVQAVPTTGPDAVRPDPAPVPGAIDTRQRLYAEFPGIPWQDSRWPTKAEWCRAWNDGNLHDITALAHLLSAPDPYLFQAALTIVNSWWNTRQVNEARLRVLAEEASIARSVLDRECA